MTQSIAFVSGRRVLPWVVSSVLLAASGVGGVADAASEPFVLTGNLQTFTAIRNTTIATSTSPAPLAIGGDNLSWQASSTVPWITLPVTSGTEAGPLAFSVNPTALPVGTSEGKIRVTDENSAVTLEATVSVTARNLVFSVSPTALVFDVNATTTGSEQQSFTIADELNGQSGSAGYEWDVISPSTQIVASPIEGNTSTTTAVDVSIGSQFLNAAIGSQTFSPLQVLAQSPGPNGAFAQAAVALSAQVRLPRAHAVFPNIVEPGPAQVTLVGKDFQDEDLATLRVNGAPPVSATRLSDREIEVDLGVLAAGRYVFTFENALNVTRSVAELAVEPRGSFGPGEIVSAGARQRLLFDSHRGLLYAGNLQANALQRFRWNGTSWEALTPVTISNVRDIDFSPNAHQMVALTASGGTHIVDDITAPSPTVTSSNPSIICLGQFQSTTITAAATGTVQVALPAPCRISGGGPTVTGVTHDLLFNGIVLPPRDVRFNTDVTWYEAVQTRLSGDRRYVAGPTQLWDSRTNTFLYTSLQNGQLPQRLGVQDTSVDLHGTRVLFGGSFVLDRTGTTLCTTPGEQASALSSDGTRLYSYSHVDGGGGQINVLSTDAVGSPTSPGVCQPVAPPIPVPQNIGNQFGAGPNPSIYGQQRVFSMTVSADDSLLFLSGPARIVAFAIP